jgi:hypothetical protein
MLGSPSFLYYYDTFLARNPEEPDSSSWIPLTKERSREVPSITCFSNPCTSIFRNIAGLSFLIFALIENETVSLANFEILEAAL